MSRCSKKILPERRADPPADHAGKGGLAGAVRADDRADLASGDLEINVFDGLHATEVPAERLGPKQDHGPVPPRAWRNVPMIPLGKAMMSTTKMMPTAIM